MKMNLKQPKVLAGIATFLMALAIIFLCMSTGDNRTLRSNLNHEKLNTEKLLSEKLMLDKEIDEFKLKMNELKGKNEDLDKLLASATEDIDQKNREINNLSNTNNKNKGLAKEIESLKNLKQDYEKKIANLTSNLEAVTSNMNLLAAQNQDLLKELDFLKFENNELNENIAVLQSMAADDYLVESLKGKKEKLTVKARKSDKLNVTFNIPDNINPKLQFRITTPDGDAIDSRTNSNISALIVDQEELTASLDPVMGDFKLNKRVQMSYDPDQKLESGVYKIEIYNNETYLGSCHIRLK